MFGPLLIVLIVGAIIGPQSESIAAVIAVIGVAPMLIVTFKFFPGLYDVELRDR